jgi:hypothetical protein
VPPALDQQNWIVATGSSEQITQRRREKEKKRKREPLRVEALFSFSPGLLFSV